MSSLPSLNTSPTASGASPSSSQQTTPGGASSVDATTTGFPNTPVLSSSTAHDASGETTTSGTTASQTLTTASTVTVSSQSGGIADGDASKTSDKPLTFSAWSTSTQSQGGSDMTSTQDAILSSGRGSSLATTMMLENPQSGEASTSNTVATSTLSGSIPNDGGQTAASTLSSSQSNTTGSGGAIVAGSTAGTRSSESFSGTYSSTLQESTRSILWGTIAEPSTATSLSGSMLHDSGQNSQGSSAGQSSASGPTEANGPTTSSPVTTLAMGSSPGDATSSQGTGPGSADSSRAEAEGSSAGDGSHSTSLRYTAASAGDLGSMLSGRTLSSIQSASASDAETRTSTTATAHTPTLSTASGSLSFESDSSHDQASVLSSGMSLVQSNLESFSNGGMTSTISAATPTSGNLDSSASSGSASGFQGTETWAMTSNPSSDAWQGTSPGSSLDQISSSSQLLRGSDTSQFSPGLVSEQTNSQSVSSSPAETPLSATGTTPVTNSSETQNQFSTSVAPSVSVTQSNNSGRFSSEESNSIWASLSRSQGSDDSTAS